MPELLITIPRDLDWLPTDTVELWLGTPDAGDLAGSTPSGGVLAAEVPAWPAPGSRGGFGAGRFGRAPFGTSGAGGGGGGGTGFGSGGFGRGRFGRGAPPGIALRIKYDPPVGSRCCTLPVGVRVRDAAGNRSDAEETTVAISQPPRGARDLAISATENTEEAELTWTASPDV